MCAKIVLLIWKMWHNSIGLKNIYVFGNAMFKYIVIFEGRKTSFLYNLNILVYVKIKLKRLKFKR